MERSPASVDIFSPSTNPCRWTVNHLDAGTISASSLSSCSCTNSEILQVCLYFSQIPICYCFSLPVLLQVGSSFDFMLSLRIGVLSEVWKLGLANAACLGVLCRHSLPIFCHLPRAEKGLFLGLLDLKSFL